jgi:hypothetical protein
MAKYQVNVDLLQHVDHVAGFKQDEVTPKKIVDRYKGDIVEFPEEHPDEDIQRMVDSGAISEVKVIESPKPEAKDAEEKGGGTPPAPPPGPTPTPAQPAQ